MSEIGDRNLPVSPGSHGRSVSSFVTRNAAARLSAFVLSLVALFPGCAGDDHDSASTEPPDEITAATDDEAQAVRWAIEDFDVGGAAVAVTTPDGRSWSAVAGEASRGAAVSEATKFSIASITKTFTATLALRLAEEDQLDLDRAVDIEGVAPATLRDLLGHTAGLDYLARHDDSPWTVDQVAEVAVASRVCGVGECYRYSDLGYVAAGLAIEQATGESLRELYQRYLFGPLELDDTDLVDRNHVPAGIAVSDEPGGWPSAPAVPVNTWSAGAIVTTATDLVRFVAALFDGDLLSGESLATMLDTDRSSGLPCDTDCPPYGLGISRYRVGGHPGWGHGGSSGAEFVHFDNGTIIAALTTKPGMGHAILDRIATVAVPALAPRSDIYELDLASRSEPTRLLHADGVDSGPSWSPDGEQLVFSSTRDQAHSQLYILDASDGSIRRLTRTDALDESPTWSPDGALIAFIRDDTETREIYVVRPDGTRLRQVTSHDTHSLWSPAWSPDGTRLAYELGEPNTPNSDIAVIDANGTDRRVLHHEGSEWWPTWSPDGSEIAFWKGSTGIAVMTPDGTEERVLSGEFREDRAPTWGPDGRIAFLWRDNVWTMHADGSARRQETDSEAIEHRPHWHPDGSRLVFASDES